ncbi:MAG: hypothetical protein KBB54_02320 [Candidatus Pacebacteria bacterium]|nr:hypothetical protein [Candidatus Paceibacterota bacterium]
MRVSSIGALAQGFKNANVKSIFNFPGFHSHELFNELGGKITSVNEKIAYELAWGSSIGGQRTVVTFKNVGLHDAMDPFMNSYYTGVGRGLVVVVFDDINLTGSQGIFDTRLFRHHTGGIWIEPKTVQECYDYAYMAPLLSESSDMPVVIRMSNTNVELRDEITLKQHQEIKSFSYAKNFEKNVVHPITGNHHFANWLTKNINLESDLDSASVGFASKSILQKTLPTVDIRLNYRSEGHINVDTFDELYAILRDHKYIVSMDLGGYTADPEKTADVCLCFGASTAVAGGIKTAQQEARVAAVIGDAPFLHSGKNVIPELIVRNLVIDIFIMDNGGSQGTGGQQVPGNIELESARYGVEYKKIHLSDISSLKSEIKTKSLHTRIFHILYT